MAEWMNAPEVEMLARQLIGKYHGHLAQAKIKYIFRKGKWSSQDKTTWAKAYRVSERDNFLTGFDFYVVVNEEVWNELDSETREAMIDHELSHCGQSDSGAWCVWGHDVEDFSAIVRRHGLWNESVRKYLQAAERREKEGPEKDQMELFEESKTTPEENDCSDLMQGLRENTIPEPRSYFDERNNRIIYASKGLGEEYGTFWSSENGGLHRVKSPAMPMVSSAEEAQRNLDAYAEKKGFTEVAMKQWSA